ncbi:MAG: ribosome small subunit-dependent GTPase A [Alicyclobacillus sp.]|nr:ribosome small subunit-dependent GTPase A [Alicyclobacillus sp.]
MEGVVTKAVAGFYTVRCADGIRQCRARGVFRKRGVTILVGDRVQVEPIGSQEGVVAEVLPRRTELIRPPVANVDQALLVSSVKAPDFQGGLLDRLLVQAQAAGLRCVVVLTKCDLAEDDLVHRIAAPYVAAGYPVLCTAAKRGDGIADVRALLTGNISVLAGASGVGKSTLANALSPDLGLKMGEISEKLGRGKHTTRHVELFALDSETYIVDAPGFSQLEVQVPSRELRIYFPEFATAAAQCAYRGCLHLDEADCGVKQAVSDGTISPLRYDSYVNLMQEILDREARKY